MLRRTALTGLLAALAAGVVVTPASAASPVKYKFTVTVNSAIPIQDRAGTVVTVETINGSRVAQLRTGGTAQCEFLLAAGDYVLKAERTYLNKRYYGVIRITVRGNGGVGIGMSKLN